jgi:dCTP deaminase
VSVLSDIDIRVELDLGHLRIEPFAERLLQPASYDVRLGGHFLGFAPGDWSTIDPRRPDTVAMRRLELTDGVFTLPPGDFVLGHTVEHITVPIDMMARYENKSSLARIGLATHFAGFIDPGFVGTITVELSNLTLRPIRLVPGMAIGQLSFGYLSTPTAAPYGAARGNHYAGQRGATASAVADQLLEAGLT